MNETVKQTVDMLFSNVVDCEETRALHDEVMNNCQEHYADLIARGFSEDDAIQEVIMSLKGMEDVIAEYQVKDAEPEREMTFQMLKCPENTLDGVRRIRIETICDNIAVLPSEDNQVNIRYDGEKQVIVTENVGDMLKIGLKKAVLDDEMQEAARPGWRDVFPKNGDGIFTFNLKALGKLISNAMENVNIDCHAQGTLTVEIPNEKEYMLEADSRSGDISLNGCTNISELKMNSTSGDVNAEIPAGMTLRDIKLNSTSGDITLNGNADWLTASTMSGDVHIIGSFKEAAMKSVSGDVELNGNTQKLQANSVSGDALLKTENSAEQDLRINTVSGDVEVSLPVGVPVNLMTSMVSGDVENHHPNSRDALIALDVKTTSGDITIL